MHSRSIVFKYDESGNRISRVLSAPERVIRRMDATPRNVSSEMSLSGESVKIEPNPTDGVIRIRIAGYGEDREYVAYVFNTSSQLIVKHKIVGAVTELDISDMADGIYLVCVVSGDNCVSSKIVKQ